MLRDNLLETKTLSERPCLDGASGKQARGPFSGKIDSAKKSGDVIHSDVVGPLPPTHTACQYFVSFIDEFTRYTTVMPMQSKGQVLQCFKDFKIMFEKQYETIIKSIHSDNGGEYTPVAQYALEMALMSHDRLPTHPRQTALQRE
jgi:hypothetical protein